MNYEEPFHGSSVGGRKTTTTTSSSIIMTLMTLLMVALLPTGHSFQQSSTKSVLHTRIIPSSEIPTFLQPIQSRSRIQLLEKMNDSTDGNDDDTTNNNGSKANVKRPSSGKRKRVRRLLSKVTRPIAFATPVVAAVASTIFGIAPPEAVHAGAPVVAIPKMQAQDPIEQAFDRHDKKMMVEAQKELSEFTAKAKAIEREQGPEARAKFEEEYKQELAAKGERIKKGLIQLKYDLLDQGIDPELDIEGRRQITLYERGVDLGDVAGTPYYVERMYEQKSPEKSFAVKKKPNREIIKYMVQDLKNRGMDPLTFFSKHKDRTEQILGLPFEKATELASQYQSNIEQYGQITVPKEGEKSVKELMAEKGTDSEQSSTSSKEETKRLKAEAKAKAAAEKAEAKAKAKAEKERQREEKKAAKEAAKAAAAAAASAASVSASAVMTPPGSLGGNPDIDTPPSSPDQVTDGGTFDSTVGDDDSTAVAGKEIESIGSTSDMNIKEDKLGGLKIVPAAAVLATVGGGAFAFKTMRERAEAEEAERQKRLKLMMGDFQSDVQAEIKGEKTMSDLMFDYENETEKEEDDEDTSSNLAGSSEQPIAPKKKRSGFKSMFGRKKNTRETDITVLIAPDAKAPEFASTLAKLLTFGAPGRFPDILALPGGMPMDTFDAEKASNILFQSKEDAGLTDEEAAEVMANVVNCMLVDIVDLASSSLKEKDQKLTVDALSIVVAFMNHAADLFTTIAEGMIIDPPVTYGGDVGKGKLEQMYSAYASSGLTNFATLDEEFEKKCDLLRFVFGINDKKAEGLMMKAVQKNLMEIMKSGEIPEGMEEMMKGMEGMGLPGMGDEGEFDPAQTMEMLTQMKVMKDSGQISDGDLVEVKKQFEQMFGGKLEDMMKGDDADELTDEEKEMLELLKDILG